MNKNSSEIIKRTITGIIWGSIFFGSLIFGPKYLFSVLLFLCLSFILIFEWPKLINYKNLIFWIITPFYPMLPFVLLIIMQQSGYRYLNIILFSLIYSIDTGSYIIGKIFGKNKIYPKISPGKTWEGFLGGYIFAIIVSTFFFKTNLNNFLFFIFPFCLLVSFLGLAGDLFESYFKRKANLKDSGFILPGHGGLLDRFDSIMFLAIFIFLIKNYLIKMI